MTSSGEVLGQGQPVSAVEWVPRDTLRANGYNPNHVAPAELALLRTSILADGWTQPIVARADGEIVDGFHRWTVAANPLIAAMTGGLVPVVRLRADLSPEEQIAATIRHNRARGVHGILPMAEIVRAMMDEHGLTPAGLTHVLGMEEEEIERLYDRGGMTERGSTPALGRGWVPAE